MATNDFENLDDSLSASIFSGNGNGTPAQTKKMRRSWFETPPATKFDIAVDKNKRRSSGGRRKSDEEIETLILTHFTSAPRIGFGSIKIGKAKSRILMVRNPHEYEQEVIVEKFPYKKNFSIDQTKFIVPAEDYVTVSITWSPDTACSCREMILFKVDGVYRLQTYVFGQAEEVKKKKVVKKKRGILGINVKKPFSIISTPGLACIRDNYSPLDDDKPRPSNVIEHPVPPVHNLQYNLMDKHAYEESPPPLESTAISISSVGFTANKDRVGELGCSPSFSPILKTSEVDGSCIIASSCFSDTQFSTLKDVHNLPDNLEEKTVTSHESGSCDQDALDTPKVRKKSNSSKSSKSSKGNENKENSPTKQQRSKIVSDKSLKKTIISDKKYLSPETFLNDSLKNEKTTSGSAQLPANISPEEKTAISPTSFLEDLNNTKNEKHLMSGIPSPSALLQNTIPHNLIVQQLQNVRSSLHEKSFERLLASAPKSASSRTPLFTESFKSVESSLRSSTKKEVAHKTNFLKRNQGKKGGDRVGHDIQKCQSPRRTTFLLSMKKSRSVQKKEEPSKSSKKSRPVTKEEKPKKRKLMASNKVGQTPVSKPSADSNDLKSYQIDTRTVTKCNGSVAQVELPSNNAAQSNCSQKLTTDKTSPPVEKIGKHSGKRLFDSDSPKKPAPGTITKERPSPHIHEKVMGKNLFDDTNNTVTPKRTSPFLDEFGSPSILPSSPQEERTRRTTLTVTKSRPSDALLQSIQTAVNNNMLECTPTGGQDVTKLSTSNFLVVEVDVDGNLGLSKKENSVEPENDPLKVEMFTQDPISPNLLGSPSRLPSSPNPNEGRRSTHLVTSPKFVDLNAVSPRRLFPPIEDSEDAVVEVRKEVITTVIEEEVVTEVLQVREESTVLVTCEVPGDTNLYMIGLNPEKSESSISLRSMEDMSVLYHDELQDTIAMENESKESCKKDESDEKSLSLSDLSDVQVKSESKVGKEKKPLGSAESRTKNTTTNKAMTSKNVMNSSRSKPTPINRRQSLQTAGSRERLNVTNISATVSKPSTDRRKSVHHLETKKLSVVKKTEDAVSSFTRSTNNRNVPRERQLKTTNSSEAILEGKACSTKSTGLNSSVKKAPASHKPPLSVQKSRGPMKGVAQSKLILIKKPKSAVPKHPMPFAARNMYYDERWQEKQERGFSHWLNFVLTPPEEYNNNAEKTKVDAGKIFVDGMKPGTVTRLAPTKEVLSIRAYTARRRMNKLRRASCLLYQSQSVIHVIRKVEIEVESRRLAVRKDRMLHADLGIKQKILDMLLCYNPLWLRIGLETVFGEMILLQSNNDVIGLSRFILYRLLSNPDILTEYAHPSVPHLYREGFAEAISSHTLKKFLMLVYFLDQAKQSRLIEHDPCLFCKNADIKASKNFLVQFSRDFLSGEGDITRHLSYLGYVVSHVQTPLDEFDYAVTALGVDLRDGLRLTRVLEYLTNNWTLVSTLRAPAISRLQKIHNVEVVFKELAKNGLDVSTLDTKLNARDIVDGHKEKTLCLLWHIIFHFQVDVLINIEQLKAEIAMLEKTLRVKISMQKLLRCHGDNQARRDSGELDVLKNERLTLLLKWCRLVCLHYGVKVENFSVSFSDGRALCYLIHHYYPTLLPQDLIKKQTTLSYMEEMEAKEEEEFDSDASFDWSHAPHSDLEKPELFEQYLNNERDNFKLLYEKVSGLGGIPLMLKAADMSNTIPDEKIVMTYVSHLCGRLLDIREESRAARVIQNAWRRYWVNHAVKQQEKQERAARVIQLAYREYKLRQQQILNNQTAVKIQAMWRGFKARKIVKMIKHQKENAEKYEAAMKIKGALETCVTRRKYLIKKAASIKIQSAFRSYQARKQLQLLQKSAQSIQNYYHGYKQMLKDRQKFLKARNSVIMIQRSIRYYLKQREQKQIQAAILIQKHVRGYLQQITYKRTLSYIVKVQSLFRRNKYRTKYLAMKFAAIAIQRGYRNYKIACQQNFEKERLHASCTLIQRWWRGMRENRVRKLTNASIIIQKMFRGYMARKYLAMSNKAATKIQSLFRMIRARINFLKVKAAVIILQHNFRTYLSYKHFKEDLKQRHGAATLIQCIWKRFYYQNQYKKMKEAVIKIQSCIRQKQASNNFKKKRQAVILIQQRYKGYRYGQQVRQNYLKTCAATLILQTAFRGLRDRLNYRKSKNAVVKIQSLIRMQGARSEYKRLKQATLILQRKVRSVQLLKKDRQDYLRKKNAVKTLQSGFKAMRCRQNYLKTRNAAIKIQKVTRMYQAQKKYMELQKTTLWMQNRVRSNQLCKNQHRNFIRMKAAALIIQTAYRKHKAMQNYLHTRKSAIKIQSQVKMYLARSHYQNLKTCCQNLQNRIRAKQCGSRHREEFLMKKEASIKIQAAYRSYRVCLQQKTEKRSITKIQAMVRCYLIRKKYKYFISTAILLQSLYRRNMAVKKARSDFLKMKKSAIIIQKQYRCHHNMRNYQTTRQAVITVQRWYRQQKQQREFLKIRNAAIQIQRLFRHNRLAQSERQNFLYKRNAAITIQSYIRGHQQLLIYKRLKESTLRIQTWWRMISRKRYFDILKQTILKLQQRVRSNIEVKKQMKNLADSKTAALVIQKYFRGYRVRREMRRQQQSAILIQSQWRAYVVQKYYIRLSAATIFIQYAWRRKLEADICRQQFMRMRAMVVYLQSLYRGCIRRKEFLAKRKAAITMQSIWKSWHARRQFLTKKKACILIQQNYRSHLQKKRMQERKHKEEMSAKLIQRLWRNYRQKAEEKRCKAATSIQAMVKSWLARRNYTKARKAVVCLQAKIRGYVTYQKYQRLLRASCHIQSKWRAVLLMRSCRRRYLMTYGAIITIQAAVRGFIARKQLNHHHLQCARIQACIRGWLQREKYLRMKCAALVLQDYYRSIRLCRMEKMKYRHTREAVIKIQNWFRFCQAKKATKREKAASVIQSWFRAQRQKQIFENYKSQVIVAQACLRGYLVRKEFKRQKHSAAIIQRSFRTHLFVKNVRKACALRHASAVVIQKTFRNFVHRKHELRNLAAIKVQRMVRGYIKRKCYKKTVYSVILIQRIWRAHHSDLKRIRAVSKIQRCYRRYCDRKLQIKLEARKSYLQEFCTRFNYNIAAIKIQRCYKQHVLMRRARENIASILHIQRMYRARQTRRDYLKLRTGVVKVQQGIRQWIKHRHQAASIIQCRVKQWLIQQRIKRTYKSAVKIQAIWRGYVLRKKTHTKKIAEVRKRISKANDSACENNKLGNRASSALDCLLRYKDMSYILEAVMHLDVATRLSPRCCERMVEVNAVCVIYKLLGSLNRSLPHMAVIRYCINILLNLAKYDKTIDYVYNVNNSIGSLLELMTIYREKGEIFTKICTLMGILALDNSIRESIASNRGYTDKVRSLYALTARKHKLQEGRNLVRAKMAASKSFNKTLPLSTPAKKKRVRPDWLLNRDSIREMEDPMQAIKFVMDNLNLVPK